MKGREVNHMTSRWATFVGKACSIAMLGAVMLVVGIGVAGADVGDLGPPPVEQEIKQTLTDLYVAAQPVGSDTDVGFDGPILVGNPTLHTNPPPEPWCVRCGYPDQGASLMYPVMALVTVNMKQNLDTSALGPGIVENASTRNGTTCPADPLPAPCPAYYFYRDGAGYWHTA